MKKIFIILAMLMSCSLFADVIQSKIYFEEFENPVLYIAKVDVTYSFSKNLQTGNTYSSVQVYSSGKNYVSSFSYSLQTSDIKELLDIKNELDYVINNVLPLVNDGFSPVLELKVLGMTLGYKKDPSSDQKVYCLSDGSCLIPVDKIKPFAELFNKFIAKYYEHKKEFESSCLPVKKYFFKALFRGLIFFMQ